MKQMLTDKMQPEQAWLVYRYLMMICYLRACLSFARLLAVFIETKGERLKPSDTMPRHRKVVAEFTSAVKNRTPDPPPPEPEELPDSKPAKKGGKQAGPPATFKKEK